MSYKSALAGLPVGGGKSVIMGDPARIKTRPLLHAYGRFIDRIGQTYATVEDVGMSVAELGRASCRERGCQSVLFSVVAAASNTKKTEYTTLASSTIYNIDTKR